MLFGRRTSRSSFSFRGDGRSESSPSAATWGAVAAVFIFGAIAGMSIDSRQVAVSAQHGGDARFGLSRELAVDHHTSAPIHGLPIEPRGIVMSNYLVPEEFSSCSSCTGIDPSPRRVALSERDAAHLDLQVSSSATKGDFEIRLDDERGGAWIVSVARSLLEVLFRSPRGESQKIFSAPRSDSGVQVVRGKNGFSVVWGDQRKSFEDLTLSGKLSISSSLSFESFCSLKARGEDARQESVLLASGGCLHMGSIEPSPPSSPQDVGIRK